MRNIDVVQIRGPIAKIIGIFASMAAIVALITVSMNGTTFADPLHCDSPGWPSCYRVGHNVGNADGRQAVAQDLPFDDSCPSGHSANFCSGYTNGYDAAYNVNGKSQTIQGGPCSTCSGSSGTSHHTADYNYGYSLGMKDANDAGIYDIGDSCNAAQVWQHCAAGYHDGYNAGCGTSKFVDACSGEAPGTLKQ